MTQILYKIQKDNTTNFLHLNISTLQYHYKELETLLSNLQSTFHFIGISESRLRKDIMPTTNIDLIGYTVEHTPSESASEEHFSILKMM